MGSRAVWSRDVGPYIVGSRAAGLSAGWCAVGWNAKGGAGSHAKQAVATPSPEAAVREACTVFMVACTVFVVYLLVARRR